MEMATLGRSHPVFVFLDSLERPKTSQDGSLGGMGKVKGNWFVPDSRYDEFLDKLHDHIFVKGGRPLNLVEQPRLNKHKPLLVDLDFKFPHHVNLRHKFESSHINEFVASVVEGLNTLFDLSTYEQVRFFVSARRHAYPDASKKIVKDGIHIQSPDICLTNEKQAVLRSWILEQNAIENAFEGIGYTNEDGAKDIYDSCMGRKQGWFLYGESKENIEAYELYSVIRYDPQTDSSEYEDVGKYTNDPRKLMKLLSVRYMIRDDTNIVRPEQKGEYDRLLRISSGKPAARPALAAAPAFAAAAACGAADEEMAEIPTPKDIGAYIPNLHDAEEIELAKEIVLECLAVDRANEYKKWMEVGWCLYNIDESEEMFDVWREFSKKSTKYSDGDWASLRERWNRGFSRDTAGAKLTLKSLHYWARDDNAEKYKELIENDLIRYVQYRVADTHYHVAKLLRRKYKGRFCASVEMKKTEWYVFDEKVHTWVHTCQGNELVKTFSREIADLVIRAKMRLKKKGWEGHCQQTRATDEDAAPDEDWFKGWAATLDGGQFAVLNKVENHLYDETFKNKLLNAAKVEFSEEKFSTRLNMSPYLFVCKNGVLDLCNEIEEGGQKVKRVLFRPGRPEDYMSQLAGRNEPDSVAISYFPHDPENPKLKELMEFLTKIFPNTEMLSYFIRLMASCLEGNNREQCYYTFIGVGGNGKSKVVDLMRYTFGDYCSSLSATALTRPRPDSGAPNPDIMAIKNKRFIYLQEPDDREPLNTSRMKQFSGEDVVEARGLHQDQERFRISGKLFMMCNSFPPINAMDRGTWRRIRVLKFGSKFVDPSDPDLKAGRPNVFLRDNDLDRKLREWREVWLALLVHVYEKEYLVNGLEPIPASVMEESNKYKESFDQYGKFKAERMVVFNERSTVNLIEHADDHVTLKEVLRAYSRWELDKRATLTGKKLNANELENRLKGDFGDQDNGIYKRCRVFDSEEDRDDFIRERTPDS